MVASYRSSLVSDLIKVYSYGRLALLEQKEYDVLFSVTKSEYHGDDGLHILAPI